MNNDDLLFGLIEMMTSHIRIPEEFSWLPLAGAFAAVLVGLLTILRGARWARGSYASGFCIAGAVGGVFLGRSFGVEPVLAAAVTAVVAGVLGFALFRLWQAALLGGIAMTIGLGTYTVGYLTPEINAWTQGPPAEDIVFSLESAAPAVAVAAEGQPAPGTWQAGLANVGAEAQDLWNHLVAHVPNFKLTIFSVMGSSGLIGFIFGLLWPRASRALWVATGGTLALGGGATGLLKHYAPDTLEWLIANPQAGWAIVGSVWLTAFVYSMMTAGPKKRVVVEDAVPATA